MSTKITPRYLTQSVQEDLGDKMVFLGGPRQVGKTTLARSLSSTYLNWDDAVGRSKILKQDWPTRPKLIVLDEIHKYARWRNLVKGFFDVQGANHSFLVTGSARLDHYRRGGDSLLGRYHYYRLHPFSLAELGGSRSDLDALLRFGGFPEPIFSQSVRTLRRWQLQRIERLVFEDLRDLERVSELSLLERLAEALPDRVGSPLSIKNLAEDLEVDFKTALRWVEIFENLYYVFRIPPYGAPKIRAVKKEQKLYLWDWSAVSLPGARLENLVASHLLKFCHFRQDREGHRMELRFLRDIDRRELDFVVLEDRKPIFAVECKTGQGSLSRHIPYFRARTSIPKFYQVHLGTEHKSPMEGVQILPFVEFCKLEGIV